MIVGSIGTALRSFRVQRGLSQGRLAEALGVAQSQLGHYETGEQAPTVRVLKRMAQICEWTTEQIGQLVLSSKYPSRKNGRKGRRLAA